MAHTLPLLLLLLNSLSCHSEVRARDPHLEEEEAAGGTGRVQHAPAAPGTPLHHHSIHLSPARTTPDSSASRMSGQTPAHRGNWCQYVTQRVVTTAVLCETQTVKAVNNCPDGDPKCQVIMQSSQPMYKQKQIAQSFLQWRCCPGYRGHNCLEKDKLSEDEEHSSKSRDNSNGNSEGKMRTDLLKYADQPNKPLEEDIHGSSPNQSPAGVRDGLTTSQPLPFLDSSILLSMHQLMSDIMSQLRPVLESFNQTLKHLSSEVDTLSQDIQKMRMEQKLKSINRGEGEGRSGSVEQRLEHNNLQISQMKTQLDSQKDQMESFFQTQQQLLKHNLTKLKEEMEDQISQNQDAQVNVQSLTELVEEVRVGQKKLEETLQREHAESVNPHGGQPTQMSGLWEAITRIDEMAQSNSVQLSSLSMASKDCGTMVNHLQRDFKNLGQRVEEVKQRTEVHFAESGLEMEATRVKVLHSIDELTANFSAHEGQLREIELVLDNIYLQLQRNDSGFQEQGCSCTLIGSSLVKMEKELANVTQLARLNRLALAEADLKRNQATEMEDLHQGLLNMKESLAFEQSRSRSLHDSVSQLEASLLDSQLEIQGLRERDQEKSDELQGLSATFTSLLNDVVRHSEVLEVLLGEEVFEFTRWTQSKKKELSIPGVLQRMHAMQQKIETHDGSLSSLWRKHPDGDEMNSDDPIAFNQATNNQVKVAESHQTPLADPSTKEEDVDYSVSDFWSLGKEVEQLAGRMTMLEERCGNCTEPPGGSVVELQADIASLRQNLENHLRMFQKLFTYTEELTSSTRSLNLDEVWRLVRKREGRRTRKHQKEEDQMKREEKSSSGRGKRYSETEHARLEHSPVAFITSMDDRIGPNSEFTSKNVAMNYGGALNPTSGVFQAPETGLYLFLVTLDFERGLSLAVLKRSGVPVASLRQERGEKRGSVSRAALLELRRGETLTLELKHGSLRKAQPGDNTLSGLLLFITEHKDAL